MTGLKEYSPEQYQQTRDFMGTIIRALYATWPKDEIRKYFEGFPAALTIVDRYYRDYLPGEIPRTMPLPDDERMNLIVLSESHARSNPNGVGAPILEEYYDLVPEEYRKGHVNLVHCLSYGEAWLAGLEGDKSATAGTPTFWRLLAVLAGMQTTGCRATLTKENWEEAFAPLNKSKGCRNKVKRVKNKIAILKKMKARKVELLDISPIHIYLASGTVNRVNKKTGNVYWTKKHDMKQAQKDAVLHESWENYMAPILRQQRPRHILVLGTTLIKAVKESNILELCQEIGTEYHGALTHPSNKGVTYVNEMNQIRIIANQSQRKPIGKKRPASGLYSQVDAIYLSAAC